MIVGCRFFFLLFSFASLACATEPLKVICAARAATAPLIDGLLDDPCWQQTEIRSDFVLASGARDTARITTMRFVYDDAALYMGLEFYWDDVEALQRGIAGIIEAKGVTKPGRCEFKGYSNHYGVELFIDPNATGMNYYQILFNAAGQYTGNYKAQWTAFGGGHTIKSAIHDSRWSVEFVFPWKGLKAGDEWGLELCRNDEAFFAMWKPISGSFHAPQLFGRVVMGNYGDWWSAVSTRGVSRLRAVDRRPASANLDALYAAAQRSSENAGALAAKHPPASRENFEILYPANQAFERDLSRLESTAETLRQIANTKPAP